MKYILFFVFFIIFCLFNFSYSKKVTHDNILVLNETVVNHRIIENEKENKAIFIKFYDPSCDYCKSLAKQWIELADENIEGIQLAVINCKSEQLLCKYWEITEVPTIYLLKERIFYVYNGERTTEDMLSFITEDWERSPRHEMPKMLDYRAIKKAQKNKKLKKVNDGFDIATLIPDMSSPTTAISTAIFVIIFFVLMGYCCTPSVETEVEDIKNTKKSKDAKDSDSDSDKSDKDTKKSENKDNKKTKTEKSSKIPSKDTKTDKDNSKKLSKNARKRKANKD